MGKKERSDLKSAYIIYSWYLHLLNVELIYSNTLKEKARDAIDRFLNYPNDYEIPPHLRSFLREVSELCPEAAYTSRALAIHCLTSSRGNTICVYHHYSGKDGHVNDNNPGDRGYKVTGIPWERNVNPSKDGPRVVLPVGALHCGCYEDDALWDFLWWKLGKQYSPTLDITEPWMMSRLEPHARGFIAGWIQTLTKLDLNDIYSGTRDYVETHLRWAIRLENKMREYREELEEILRQNQEKEIRSRGKKYY